MQAFLSKGMITHPNEIDESDDYSDNEEEPNNDPENDEEADDENEAEFDFQEEVADPVDEMLQKKQVCIGITSRLIRQLDGRLVKLSKIISDFFQNIFNISQYI